MIWKTFDNNLYFDLPHAISYTDHNDLVMHDIDARDKFVFIRKDNISYYHFPITTVIAYPNYKSKDVTKRGHSVKCATFLSIDKKTVIHIPMRYIVSTFDTVYKNDENILFVENLPKAETYPPILFTTENYDKLYTKYEEMKHDEETAEAKRKAEEEAEYKAFEWNKNDAQYDYDMEVRDDFRKELDELLEKYGVSLESKYDLDEEGYSTYVIYHGFPVDELDGCRYY